MSGCEAQAAPGQEGSPLLCPSAAVPAWGSQEIVTAHMCMGSWSVLGRRASQVPRGKEADQNWHGGQARARLCPRLVHACPTGCWSPSHHQLHRQKRGRSSGDAAGPGEQQRSGGPGPPAHAVCTGHPSSALQPRETGGAGAFARQAQAVGHGQWEQLESIPSPTSLWRCSQARDASFVILNTR